MTASAWAPDSSVIVVNAENGSLLERFTATAGQTLFNLTAFVYAINTGSIRVYRNGVKLPAAEVLETANTQFVLDISQPLVAGETIECSAVLGSADAVTAAALSAANSATEAANSAILAASYASSAILGNNLVINGDFQVWQAIEASTLTSQTSINYYSADQWGGNRAGDVAGQNISRVAGSAGARYALKWQRAAGDISTASMNQHYALSTEDSLPLAGKTVTLAFNLKKGANYSGGNVTAALVYGLGTDQREYAFTGKTAVNSAATVPASTTQRVNISGSIPANATQVGFELYWTPVGTAGADDSITLEDFFLAAGSLPMPMLRRKYSEELALCQRFYEKSFDIGTVPAQNAGTQASYRFPAIAAGAVINRFASISFKVQKRSATPVVTLYNPSAANAQVRDANAPGDCTSSSAVTVSTGSFTVNTTGAAGTVVGNALLFHWTADARF